MDVQKEILPNLILHYVEDNMQKENEEGEMVNTAWLLSFSFYGKSYMVYLTDRNLQHEWPSFAMMEGDSDLMESFENIIEEKCWDAVKEYVAQFEKHQKEWRASYE